MHFCAARCQRQRAIKFGSRTDVVEQCVGSDGCQCCMRFSEVRRDDHRPFGRYARLLAAPVYSLSVGTTVSTYVMSSTKLWLTFSAWK